MRFTKMHGAGNDYVYVDVFDQSVEDAPAVARAVSDRHAGIGGDGLILMAPSDTADVRMIMYNADGSRAQMCGNGIRCLAALARSRGRVGSDTVRVATDDGIKVVTLTDGGARVDMGAPRVGETLSVRGLQLTCVSMGNPHAVVYVDDVETFDVHGVGAALENDRERFPERVNVSFVQVLDRGRVLQRTWERGSGETQACGTGACAVCVAGVATGRTDNTLSSRLPGGTLVLEWDGAGSVFMTGPAVEVFSGEWRGDGV
ncbi:MAG: diaminopimelate epimerase [Planctomycetota bacterium]|nr:diaminopimelate epimerase [Planctomycetota bacterium]